MYQKQNQNKIDEKNFQVRRPQAGKSIISSVMQNAMTPICKIKFSNIVNPFYYTNSPNIPRYSMTIVIDPDAQAEFLKQVQLIEANEGTQSVLKDEISKDRHSGEILTTGKFLLKFQSKAKPETFKMENNLPVPMEVTEELPYTNLISIKYDVIRYIMRTPGREPQKGLSFQPRAIYIHGDQKIMPPAPPQNTYRQFENESPF